MQAAASALLIFEISDITQKNNRKDKQLESSKELAESIQKQINDAIEKKRQRWLIAIISDTGMRLSEAAGLCKDDIHLDEEVPYVDIKPHPWRRLKTAGSHRKIPLIGMSLWAARGAHEASNSPFLFPRYCDEKECHSNSASAALNKWLRPKVPNGCVIHSFRHSIRDRLRAVECPQDLF